MQLQINILLTLSKYADIHSKPFIFPGFSLHVFKSVSFVFKAGNKIDSMYMMEKSAWTYYILFLLRQLKFFNNSDQLGEDEILIGRFIELFLKISDNNCHEVRFPHSRMLLLIYPLEK